MAEIGRRGGAKVAQDRAHMAEIGRRGGAKVSFDSIDHYLAGLTWTLHSHAVDGLVFQAVDRRTLAEVYRRGAATIPQNRDAYLRKLSGLDASP